MPNQRMVQAWRAGNWPAGMFFDRAHQPVFDHSGIGEDMKPHLEGGWHKMYWDPLAKALAQWSTVFPLSFLWIGSMMTFHHLAQPPRENTMKRLFIACLALSMSAAAFAVAPAAQTAQQTKMATCNHDATGKKGDERKTFMKECLSAKPEMTAQQSKMKTCNADAAGKKGDERKAFMKTCLSAAAPMTQQDKMKVCNTEATGKKGDDRKAFMKTCLSAK